MLKNKPEIRFTEFKKDWVHQSLNKVVERVIRKNKNNESKVPLTISAQYGLVDQVTYFNKQIASTDLSNYFLLQKGDFAYNKSYSKDYPWGAIKRLDKYEEGVLSSLYIVFKPTRVHSDFLVPYYETSRWYKEVSMRATEGARNHGLLNISAVDFLETELSIPVDFEEQMKIGNFFRDLDETISLHQQELEALKQTKQGFLQKMFPKDGENIPQFRFDEFTKPWTKIEFEKVIKLVGGATPLKENKEYWNGDIVWLSSQEIKNKYVSKGTYLITEQAVKDNRTKVVSEGTPLIVTRSGILAKRFPISISLNEVAINQDIKALIFDRERFDTEFLVAEIKSKESYILKNIVKTGTTVQSVNLPDLNRMNLYIPEYEEQLKIGKFFRELDEVIDLKEKELEALKETKKGFLQKMFV
ncbi:restriction endonuclease subunit S [Exiguobacterium sp. B2(2022)]|uniref:restriction endonuclease subunit S n=1 Tax=Exiguobacterium sp. B2(2022) TaxID=2992755 RepID=UPI00237BF10C|nr:restriction endonuclease subunit S [Exiguobacterium sp. B2(2022)]MDE0564412.1 restriction endonuclease subunit S [Exiguobacterium sp. B2(2022)]